MFLSVPAQNFRFDHLGIENGLSHVTINDIYQDELGRMWFATRDGLNCYNGSEMRVFKPVPGDTTSLSMSNIRTISGDGNGKLYIQSLGAITVFDMKRETFRDILKGGNNAIGKGNDTTMWIYSKNKLCLYKNTTDRIEPVYEFDNKFTYAYFVYEATNKTCWIGTNNGLYCIDSNRNMKSFFSGSVIRAIHEDKKQNLWICTADKGLFKFSINGELIKNYRYDVNNPSSIVSDFVRAICEDNQGYIWIGSQFGLCRLNPDTDKSQTFLSYPEDPWSLRSKSILSLKMDKQGSVWIGTYFGGVSYLNPESQTFKYYHAKPGGLPFNIVGKFAEDKNGIIWICTEGGGIASYNPQTEQFKSFDLKGKNFKEIYYDKDNHCLWLGTHVAYLVKFDITTLKSIVFDGDTSDPKKRFGPNIMGIEKYADTLLMSTSRGIMAYNPKTGNVERFGGDNLVYQVTATTIDSKNRLWIGTESEGLISYDLKTTDISYFRSDSKDGTNLSADNINTIYEDKEHNIWIGTNGFGLNLYQPETNDFKVFTKEQHGLLDNSVVAISESKDGTLLVGTSAGLSTFSVKNKVFTNYQYSNGFPLTTINESSLFVSKSGDIYIGGVTGMAVFAEQDLQHISKPFSIQFTKLYVDNQEVKQGDETGLLNETLSYVDKIKINPGYSVFSIGFTTDNYIKAYQDEVQYRLKGYESQWLDAKFGGMLTYTNLSPGNYVLELRVKSFPETVKSLEIAILPPFYKTWYAYLLYILLFAGLFYWFIRQSKTRFYLKTSLEFEKKEKEKNEEYIQSKLRFFTNISHEFRTPITLIVGQTENLLQSHSIHPSIYNKILNIHKNASNLGGLINELLDFRKQEQGHLQLKITQVNFIEFLKEIYITFSDYANNNNILFNFQRTSDKIDLWLDVEQMQKVMNNLLSNAFKFTPRGGSIIISVEETTDDVIFSVSDTGQGILPDKIDLIFDRFYQTEQADNITGTGIGLALAKGIVQAHSGKIKVGSNIGQGTTFFVTIKKGDAHYPENVVRLKNRKEIYDYKWNSIDKEFVEEVKKSQQESGAAQCTLLIVEDNKDIRELLKDILEPIYKVEIAVDGLDGLEKVRKIQPDIVISDIMMPGISGIELCAKMKSNFDTCHIPIILLTAKTAVEHKFEGWQIGADDYITKPFDLKLLILRCNNLVNSRKLLQAKYARQNDLSGQQVATTAIDMEFIKKATALVENNLDDSEFNIDVFAREMGLGRTTLFNKIRGITGLTPNNFISNIRLKKAADLLLNNPELNISDIAYTLGFSSPRYFNKCFKDLFGYSPVEYRKNSN